MPDDQPATLRFAWDEAKNRQNTRKHGLDFADAEELFDGLLLVALDERDDYREDRWVGVGLLRGRVVVVVYTDRGDDVIRIISLRKALSHERSRYEEALRDRLGTH